MWPNILLCVTLISVLIDTACGLWCYRCQSNQPGCGSEMSIRLQRWHWCDDPGPGGYENFCVKVVERKGSEDYITRECLMTLVKDTNHRRQMPTVRRHNYCSPARSIIQTAQDTERFEDNTYYCFCNDWNGCNPATKGKPIIPLISTLSAFVTVLLYWLH